MKLYYIYNMLLILPMTQALLKQNRLRAVVNHDSCSLPCFLILAWFILWSTSTSAQLLRDYSSVEQADPWLTSPNAAGLTRYASPNIATAELSISKQEGELTNFDGSPNMMLYDAGISSYYRIGERAVLYGSMSFNSLSGKDMAGSAFIPRDTHRPFDIVEDSLSNLGRKRLDNYRLSGGVGYSFTNPLAIGARVDYTAANYAKYKDLRHQNKLMDLRATVGLLATLNNRICIGTHYLYRRNIENVNFSTNGKSDKVYKSLIDYGAFFGRVEQFGNEGYTDKSREMPFVDERHGLGVQLSTPHLSPVTTCLAIDYAHRHGYYGRKSPYTITYTHHSGDQMLLSASMAYKVSTACHRLDFSLEHEKLHNNAATSRELKNASGATYYEYYTPVETADKQWLNGKLAYTLNLDMREELPLWTLQTGINWMSRRQTSYLYPYYCYQRLSNYEFFLHVDRSLIFKKGVWTFALGGSFLKGSGEPFTISSFDVATPLQASYATMPAYLYREYQYLTAAQYAVGGQVKYAFLFPGTKVKTYARLRINHCKANETFDFSNGSDRTQFTLAMGCVW